MTFLFHRATRRSVVAGLFGLFSGWLHVAAVKKELKTQKTEGPSTPSDAKQGTSTPHSVRSDAAWLKLPPTPDLPKPNESGTKVLNGVPLFFAVFGKGKEKVLFLHGGLGNSNYWAHQIDMLSDDYTVIVMDTRGHGRSPLVSQKLGYRDFAEDACALLESLQAKPAAIVGWSDGAITGLHMAIHKPEFVTKVFAFGANSNPSGLKPGGSKSPVFAEYAERAKKEYQRLSPKPDQWSSLSAGLAAMWKREPNFTKKELASITVPVTISDGDHDEIIRATHNKEMSDSIPKSRRVFQNGASHFAMLQSPEVFTEKLREFLAD